MLWRGKKAGRTAALAVALLWAASPGWAAPRDEPMTSWARLWERALIWIAGAPAGRQGREKSSGMIDPNGLTAPASAAQSDSSAGIDPLGRPDYSAGIDPNGSH